MFVSVLWTASFVSLFCFFVGTARDRVGTVYFFVGTARDRRFRVFNSKSL